MDITQIHEGDKLKWHRTVSNYGHCYIYPVTVLKIGKRRVTIETDGGHKASVNPENLS